jgi:hypothetical protein
MNDRFLWFEDELHTGELSSLTPWNEILEKLIATQLVKEFSAFYGTRSFITVFTRASYWSLS